MKREEATLSYFAQAVTLTRGRSVGLLASLLLFLSTHGQCGSAPDLLFERNSLRTYWDSTENYRGLSTFSQGIAYYVRIMNSNPNIRVKVSGYRDKTEARLLLLPLRRAHYIKKLLCQQNISPARIQASRGGCSDYKFYYNHPQSDSLSKNRRVNFVILDFDFKP